MGWKAFKTFFEIKHMLDINAGELTINSGYATRLAVVDMHTGELKELADKRAFLEKYYPQLLLADASQLLGLLKTNDVFESDVVVYTYEGSKIIQKFCEKPGWPNVTHCGVLMHDNQFSTDKETVIEWAMRDALLGLENSSYQLETVRTFLAHYQQEVATRSETLEALRTEFPAHKTRVGKKAAARLLDGVGWSEMP